MKLLLWVGLGGALGALARYGVSAMTPAVLGRELAGTLIANVSGSFLIGLLLALVTGRAWPSTEGRAFVAIGLLGGLTTYSFLTYQALALILAGEVAAGLGYAAGSVGLGLIALFAGAATGALLAGPARRDAGVAWAGDRSTTTDCERRIRPIQGEAEKR